MIDDETRFIHALRHALPPVGEGGPSPDLWPELARRVDAPAPRMPWLDLMVAAAVLLAMLTLPAALPTLLYLL